MSSFDVVIIGGGLGGLTAAAILAKEGLSVCVLEQHSVIGGCLQSFKRNGYTLDTGMHYVGALSNGQIMNQYFKYLNVMDSLKIKKLNEDAFDCFHFKDGTAYDCAMGYEKNIERLSEMFPNEKSNISRFYKLIERIGSLISIQTLKEGMISRGGMEYMSMSVYEEIENNIKEKRLKNILAANTGLYAGNKFTTSLYEYGLITNSYLQSAYAFVGGSQQIADLLVNTIENNGGIVRLNSKVKSINLENNVVKTVSLITGEDIMAKWCISSVHPTITFSLLNNNYVYKKAFFTRMNSLKNSYGFFTTYLLIKPGTLRYNNQNHYLINSSDMWTLDGVYKGLKMPGLLLYMQPNDKNEYVNVVTLLTPMSYSSCEKWINTSVEKRGVDYKEFKDKYSDAMIEYTCEYFPSLKSCIYKKYTATPLTYRDYTSTPCGSAYGIIKDCRNPMVTLLPAKTRIANLLLTGQNLNVHGCLGTTISSAVTCSEIIGIDYLSKKIGNA